MKLWLSILLVVAGIVPTVTRTAIVHAASESVVLYQVQTAGPVSGTATQEIVLLYNVSTEEVDVTNWCVTYSSSNDTVGFSACIESSDAKTRLYLEPNGVVSFATQSFVDANVDFIPDVLMSGGMAAASGHVKVYDAADKLIDTVGWGGAVAPEGLASAAHSVGLTLSRSLDNEFIDSDINAVDFSSLPLLNPITSGLFEVEVLVDVCTNIDGMQTELPNGFMYDEALACIQDVCLNIEGLQATIPANYELDAILSECIEIPLEDRALLITELLPNPPSYDTGLEFIELYNPHAEQIELAGYAIHVGPSFTKKFVFSGGFIVPNEYLTFTDFDTDITLPNTNGVALRLFAPNGGLVYETPVYSNAGDEVSWALVNDQWIYTNQITPAAANLPYLEAAEDEVLGLTSLLAPCPAGKYRNPETNRCRNIESAVSQLTPCDEDEYRNPETNRCRKIQTASTLAPCPEGQERNPETNRCRKVSVLGVSSSDDLPTVTDVTPQTTEGQVNWTIILLALLGTFGYIAYEWRSELGQRLVKFRLTE